MVRQGSPEFTEGLRMMVRQAQDDRGLIDAGNGEALSHIWSPVPGTQNPEPSTQNPEPRTQNPEPRTQYLVPST